MGIKVLQVNIQNWDSNHYLLKCSLSNSNPGVVLLNEISLKLNSIHKISGYKCLYKCPERYTAVAIFVKYVHKHFFIEFDNDHILPIRLFTNLGPINIVTCYTPPHPHPPPPIPHDSTTILKKKLIKFWTLIFLLCYLGILMQNMHSLTTAHKAEQTPGATNYTPFVWQGTFSSSDQTLTPIGIITKKAHLTSSWQITNFGCFSTWYLRKQQWYQIMFLCSSISLYFLSRYYVLLAQ